MANEGINVYAVGIVTMSICAPAGMARDEIERQANAGYPTGISNYWVISQDNFADGSANPHSCEQDGDWLHYLLAR